MLAGTRLQNIHTRCSRGMPGARPPRADVGLASGYFSRSLISSSCQLKQGWQPTGWRLQHGRARRSGDEKVNKHWCHPRAAARAAAPGLCDSLRVPGEPRWPGQSKHKPGQAGLGGAFSCCNRSKNPWSTSLQQLVFPHPALRYCIPLCLGGKRGTR